MEHLIIGMGQVGSALFEILKKKSKVTGIDLNSEDKFAHKNPDVMHICFPYSENFVKEVNEYKKAIRPEFVIIHSTVLPGTTEAIQYVNTFYSPVRGQHDFLVQDLHRYTKYIAPEPPGSLLRELEKFFLIRIRSRPIDLEIAKLLDTAQYGINIAWAQEAERIAKKFEIPFGFVREFGKETQDFYELRPDIRPGFCGGNCVRQNIALLRRVKDSKFFDAFIESNRKKAEELGIQDEVDYD